LLHRICQVQKQVLLYLNLINIEVHNEIGTSLLELYQMYPSRIFTVNLHSPKGLLGNTCSISHYCNYL